MNLQRDSQSRPLGAAGRSSGEAPHGRVAIIDLGSNSVRLVVYDTPTRLPIPMFNEKADCGLVRGLEKSGRLSPEGVKRAFEALSRFVRLARSMGVDRLELVATAATRDAADGLYFVQEIERRFKINVQVPSGAEEARLAALGLLSGVPGADGLLGDMGGGSLDLVALDKGEFGANATLPLGHLRLTDVSGGCRKKTRQLVEREFSRLPWLEKIRGRTLYAVGGSWRSIAKIHIEQTGYPIHIIDGFTMSYPAARRLARILAGLSEDSLSQIKTVSKRRAETLPCAAMAFEHLLSAAKPAKVVFSGFGMREGQMIKGLPEEIREQDPLIAGCEALNERSGRFSLTGREIYDWSEPLFPKASEEFKRLRLVAGHLSDIGWTEHPDYRAEHAFYRVLRLPYARLTHANRAFLAMAILIRYNGSADDGFAGSVWRILDDEARFSAQAVGRTLRLAHTLSGSAPGLLEKTKLKLKDGCLTLKLPEAEADVFRGDAVERRLRALARMFDLKGEIS